MLNNTLRPAKEVVAKYKLTDTKANSIAYSNYSSFKCLSLKKREELKKDIWKRWVGLTATKEIEKVDDVYELISQEFCIPKEFVIELLDAKTAIHVAEKAKKEFFDEIVGDKIPALKQIVGLSLHTVKEFLLELAQDKERIKNLQVFEAKQLTTICTEVNQMLRLEVGESTQNVAVVNYTFEDTKKVLKDLKAIDPIFEYPEIRNESESGASAPCSNNA